MSASDNLETDVLAYFFKGTAPSYAAQSDFYLSLHTADPTDSGNQSSNETAYTSYARATVTRATGFSVTVSAGVTWAFNVATVTFAAATGGPSTITHFGVGTSSTAAASGTLLFSGALNASLIVNAGITPQFNPDQLRIILD